MELSADFHEKFASRHIGPDDSQISEMVKLLGAPSLDGLIDETIPSGIRLRKSPALPIAQNEAEFLAGFRKVASKNKVFTSFIGAGYYNTITPPVILRNIFENPGWYTAYTPYQAEIAQGRLEALINFQTVIIDLTGLPVANASLLDEATAAAEAMHLLFASRKPSKKNATKFFVAADTFPQTLDVLSTRAEPTGIRLQIGSWENLDLRDPEIFGVLLQNPDDKGAVHDYTDFIERAHAADVLVAMAVDLMALVLLKSPGEMGADVAVGSSQRFGVPIGYGGPHAAFFATRDEYKRQVPGRLIGVSVDSAGHPAYRMALQTREQHIRREKATSNICTAQVLLAVMAGMYAVYHGAANLKRIAARIHSLTRQLAEQLSALGLTIVNEFFFDTLTIKAEVPAVRREAEAQSINFRYTEDGLIGISLDETTTRQHVRQIAEIFSRGVSRTGRESRTWAPWPSSLIRQDKFLTHPVFNTHHSELEMTRYIKKLENKDLSMVHSMIPLGSCTMKLNATTEMIPVTWPELNALHPFAPADQVEGYSEMMKQLADWLSAITGFPGVSLQPNSGAQGEFAGLMVIRAYHHHHSENKRDVALIPASAHGTNPASAVMAGMGVVVVKSDELGKIDLIDLAAKAEQYKDRLACLMVTYPSTHGVFEEGITEICRIVHEHGGLVYMDGANMNAQVGLTSPAQIGADVCHLNLHKTFCIPHGGGGPGMGPICAVEKLIPFLPGHWMLRKKSNAVAAAPYGSANILAISYAYIALMGGDGLAMASKVAILNANYIKHRLEGYYPVLYSGTNGRCAHELIVDCREFKKSGIDVEDIAKRLMDYGFHAPTVSFPVAGTLMIEPTESEALEELDRFCDAMIGIHGEIMEVVNGSADRLDNLLTNAPHTAAIVTADEWTHPYSRHRAAYPLPFVSDGKFWPSVSRIDNAYGDRNLFCSCPPIELYDSAKAE